MNILGLLCMDYSFRGYAKFSEILTFLTPTPLEHTRTCAYQGLRNNTLISYAYVLNERFRSRSGYIFRTIQWCARRQACPKIRKVK